MNTDNPKVSGVELEIEILTRLCGWGRWGVWLADPAKYGHCTKANNPSIKCEFLPFYRDERMQIPHDLPPISTDETAAMLVVRTMKDRGYRLLLENLLDSPLYLAAFHTYANESHEGQSESAAKAICLAALEYLNAQPKGE